MAELRRDDSWIRRKRYLGLSHPEADANGYEKFVRFQAEVPPEMAPLIEAAHRRALGVNASSATRAGCVRHGLRLLLEAHDPEPPPAIDVADGVEVLPVRELVAGDG